MKFLVSSGRRDATARAVGVAIVDRDGSAAD
jgi:hypothetical protein